MFSRFCALLKRVTINIVLGFGLPTLKVYGVMLGILFIGKIFPPPFRDLISLITTVSREGLSSPVSTVVTMVFFLFSIGLLIGNVVQHYKRRPKFLIAIIYSSPYTVVWGSFSLALTNFLAYRTISSGDVFQNTIVFFFVFCSYFLLYYLLSGFLVSFEDRRAQRRW